MTLSATLSTEPRALPLAGNIGAVLDGISIGNETTDAEVAFVRRSILQYKVVFLRNQDLDYERQTAFARRLGPLTAGHPIFPNSPEKPALRRFDSRNRDRANHWHTDLTFMDRPPAFALLRSVVAPEVGGDTIWANAAFAYQTLPEPLQRVADTLRIVHSNDSDYTDATVADRANYISVRFEAEHSAVQVHAETGERIVVVGGFSRRVVGFPPAASRDMIRVLQEHVIRPEHTVRWRWRTGDLAIWDNLATQHYALYDYGDQRRINERVTVAGAIPVGVDGRQSVTISGDTAAFNQPA